MKTIKLEIEDNIFDKVMFLLNNLPKRDIRLTVENRENTEQRRKLNAISIKTKNFKFDREEAHAR